MLLINTPETEPQSRPLSLCRAVRDGDSEAAVFLSRSVRSCFTAVLYRPVPLLLGCTLFITPTSNLSKSVPCSRIKR